MKVNRNNFTAANNKTQSDLNNFRNKKRKRCNSQVFTKDERDEEGKPLKNINRLKPSKMNINRLA